MFEGGKLIRDLNVDERDRIVNTLKVEPKMQGSRTALGERKGSKGSVGGLNTVRTISGLQASTERSLNG